MEIRAQAWCRVLLSRYILAFLLVLSCAEGFGCFTVGEGRFRGGSSSSMVAAKSSSLLDQWVSHKDASFHLIRDPDEVRSALLRWYDSERRMLPWRGDPPPWTGSTASNGKPKKQHAPDPGDELRPYPVTAYGIWVTEIMCQQTRVEAVIPYWIRWMRAFPTVRDLAVASEEQVNAHWAGLGFYRRARLLHEAAKYVVNELDGEMPRAVEGLMKLSGVGRYTACAIASIAYNVTVPVVDGNVCRVLSRLTLVAQHIKAPLFKDKWAWDLAQHIVEAGDGSRPGCVNSALMELGATLCAPSGTGFDDKDPLKQFYLSTRLGKELQEAMERKEFEKYQYLAKNFDDRNVRCPVCADGGVSQVLTNFALMHQDASAKKSKTSNERMLPLSGHSVFPLNPPKLGRREEVYAVAVLSYVAADGGNRWLLVRRPKDGLLANQWEFPAAIVWTSDDQSKNNKRGNRKDLSIDVPNVAKATRKKALDSLMDSLKKSQEEENMLDLCSSQRIYVGETPIEHVFSHVRHTMWIEYARLTVKPETEGWVDANGREVRWMGSSDMEQVGVTTGVKKIIQAVHHHIEGQISAPIDSTRKRKRL